MTKKYIVITTIHEKTEGIRRFEQFRDWHIILVGDRKTPAIASTEKLTFLSVAEQEKLGYEFVKHCPYNHYARKNIGYLYAYQQGAEIIYDTDDDNLPYEHWHVPDFSCHKHLASNRQFVNIYRYFTEEFIWPRGYPLDEIHATAEVALRTTTSVPIGVWQGLADLDPDVDAIFRLVFKKTVTFQSRPPVFLERGHYCPFNSQNTFWQKQLFGLLYLPATTSFRFTDILRGYIAQRLMWEQKLHLGFLPATVYQERNPHDLLRDLREEIECYLNVKEIVEILENLALSGELLQDLSHVYTKLAEAGFVSEQEVLLCQSWISDFKSINAIAKNL